MQIYVLQYSIQLYNFSLEKQVASEALLFDKFSYLLSHELPAGQGRGDVGTEFGKSDKIRTVRGKVAASQRKRKSWSIEALDFVFFCFFMGQQDPPAVGVTAPNVYRSTLPEKQSKCELLHFKDYSPASLQSQDIDRSVYMCYSTVQLRIVKPLHKLLLQRREESFRRATPRLAVIRR